MQCLTNKTITFMALSILLSIFTRTFSTEQELQALLASCTKEAEELLASTGLNTSTTREKWIKLIEKIGLLKYLANQEELSASCKNMINMGCENLEKAYDTHLESQRKLVVLQVLSTITGDMSAISNLS